MAISFRSKDGRTFGIERVEIPPQPCHHLPCDMKGAVYEGKDITPPKAKRAPRGTFDRNAYQRELMRKRRAALKEQNK